MTTTTSPLITRFVPPAGVAEFHLRVHFNRDVADREFLALLRFGGADGPLRSEGAIWSTVLNSHFVYVEQGAAGAACRTRSFSAPAGTSSVEVELRNWKPAGVGIEQSLLDVMLIGRLEPQLGITGMDRIELAAEGDR